MLWTHEKRSKDLFIVYVAEAFSVQIARCEVYCFDKVSIKPRQKENGCVYSREEKRKFIIVEFNKCVIVHYDIMSRSSYYSILFIALFSLLIR